jgi:hypothetical protein
MDWLKCIAHLNKIVQRDGSGNVIMNRAALSMGSGAGSNQGYQTYLVAVQTLNDAFKMEWERTSREDNKSFINGSLMQKYHFTSTK